jgi:MFS superfamily sulfate permease-like transporter
MFASANQLKDSCAKNFAPAIVLFLVALPLNLGVAIASGVPAYLGVVSGLIGSLVVGALTGAPLMVSGPDAGIGVLVLEMIQAQGIEMLGAIVLLAGLMQLALGLLRGANWFRAISPAVVNGMLGGMGMLIILTQFHIMLDDTPSATGFENLIRIPEAVIKGLIPAEGLPHHPAACVGAITMIVAVIWGRASLGWAKKIPAALIALAFASALTAFFKLPIQLVSLPSNIFADLQFPSAATFMRAIYDPEIWLCAVTLAFVVSAQSLISAGAVDQAAARSGSRANFDKELIAQGVGNTLCGLLGALPIAGVLLRSMANVQSGATSGASNMMHGALMLLAVLACPKVLSVMPTAALAAILVLIGYRMVVGIYDNVKGYEKAEIVVFGMTVIAILATNLFTGLVVGFVVAVGKEIAAIAHLEVKLEPVDARGRMVLHLWGPATLLQLPKLAKQLDEVPARAELHIRLDEVTYIDHACLELLMRWGKRHREHGGEFVIDWGPLEARRHAASGRRRRASAVAPVPDIHHSPARDAV